jgi:hypothetical protein
MYVLVTCAYFGDQDIPCGYGTLVQFTIEACFPESYFRLHLSLDPCSDFLTHIF